MISKSTFLAVFVLMNAAAITGQPIQLHPDNPHYFLYNDKPTVLVTSAEHYGAVINRAFDYETYLHTLERIGLNHTRIFLGDYFERPGSFGIETNTLAPDADDILTPWQRSAEPGYVLGGNKFDLDKWDSAYFDRLISFMNLAQEKGIIVEVVLFFISVVDDTSPLYGENNINGMPNYTMNTYRTLANDLVLDRQKAYCEKLVEVLNPFDNLIINIINEPWFFNQISPSFSSPPPVETLAWIQRVSEWIVQAEQELPNQHLLATDYCNEGVEMPLEHVHTYFKHLSIFNHHYDAAAESVIKNYNRIPKAWSFNETGIMPTATPAYRFQGWKYLMNGGALYNNLDFTYQVGNEDGHGTTLFTKGYSGYLGCTDHDMKYQMANLLSFWNELDFIHMKPGNDFISFRYGHVEVYGFAEEGKTYVVYFIGSGEPRAFLHLTDGRYQMSWLEPRTLQLIESSEILVKNNSFVLAGPGYLEDIVVKLTRLEDE